MRILDGRLIFSASDLNNFLECPHLTRLDLAVALGDMPDRPPRSASAELVARKGDEHERAYLRSLEGAGKRVVEIEGPGPSLAEVVAAAKETIEAMRGGSEVIYQAVFLDQPWLGIADFLLRVDGASNLGDWSYEVADTKLARRVKPYYLLQLCFYSEHVARLQGETPRHIHAVLGTGERRTFVLADFAAYYRTIKAHFLEQLESGSTTYPHPVEHCAICPWSPVCDGRRLTDDHLSLVANIRRDHVVRLEAAGITKVAELATASAVSSVPRMVQRTFANLRQQARLQHERRVTGCHHYELLEPEPLRGLALLPPSSAGDLFFDMEGDPFHEGGLEYLFGVAWREAGQCQYRAFWAHNRAEERAAFEGFVDFALERLERSPDLHVYHYAHYEPTALKRLMGQHGTREDEIDRLLREERLVDLYAVVRQAIRISQPSYSIKKLEAFYMSHPRATSVTDGADSIVAYEEWLDSQDQSKLDELEQYNRADCESTAHLRDWLLRLTPEAERQYACQIKWQPPEQRPPSEEAQQESSAREELKRALLEGFPADSLALPSREARARWLMAQLLDYHRREDKPVWWAYFDRLSKSPEELVEEADSIGDLTEVDGVPPEPSRRSLVHTLGFPTQEHKLAPGDACDPTTGKSAGTIVDIDDGHGLLRLRRGPGLLDAPLPRALIPPSPLQTAEQRAALGRLARQVVADGVDGPGPYRALRDILLLRPPRVRGIGEGQPLQMESVDLERAEEIASNLDASYLFIQGPPGSGKTYVGARLIIRLMRRGYRVGVSSNSHKAIHNLLDEVERVAVAEGFQFLGLKKASQSNPESSYAGRFIKSSTSNADFPPAADVQLVAGTAWLFARKDMDESLDYLFVDEAGQVALANAVAMGTSARNLVLLGDPLQLAQVSQGVHPDGAGASVLEHLLGEHATIPADRGLFLDHTRRLHPDLCRFISEIVYEDRLESAVECASRSVESSGLSGTGLRYLPVPHEGNSQASPEEAAVIRSEIERLLEGSYEDRACRRPLVQDDILVVAPYNAQVRCLRAALPEGIRVGTVDKFQGQEAAIVLFSMATSSGEELPRDLEFLFSRNRLNVAISRAKCLAVLVASPKLLHIRCRTPDHMRMVNALCRLVEMARPE